MIITYLGHACFSLESEGYRILTDPYREIPFPPLSAEAHEVFCSHGHFDHAATETVTLLPAAASPFTVTEIPCYHDEVQGAKRGENTIRVFEAEGIRVAHLGDLGHLLREEQLAALGEIDVLLIPVGGVYTLDPAEAKQTADAIDARIVVPMHYRRGNLGLSNIADVEDFLRLYSRERVQYAPFASFDPADYGWETVLLPTFGA